MNKNLHLLLFGLLLFSSGVQAQLRLNEAQPVRTIDFSSSMQTTVGTTPSTAFSGAGFAPSPTTPGRLNSNAWSINGLDFGALPFGGTQTVDDFARGSVSTGVVSGGIYAFTDLPATVANPMLVIQPTGNDFNPGSITLRIQNAGSTPITQLTVSYDIFVRNDQDGSSTFNFSHSPDNVTFEHDPSMDYTTPAEADGFQIVQEGFTPSREVAINGINVAPGAYYYIRWSSQDVVVSPERDEIGLDNIVVSAFYGPPAPEIRVQSLSGVTILHNDVTPTVAKGTDFAPANAPLSTVGVSQTKSFYIQNLGGAPLQVTMIDIVGPGAADFSVVTFGPNPVGTYAPVGSSGSQREFSIKFDPSLPGPRIATVRIHNNDANENPYLIRVSGHGRIPEPDIRLRGGLAAPLEISNGSAIPQTLNNTLYGDVALGASQTKDFRITNTSADVIPPLLLTGDPIIQISGNHPGDFVVTTQPAGNALLGGDTRTFAITFSPTATGIRNAWVTILSNDVAPDPFTGVPESPYTFMIQGRGDSPEIDVRGNSQPIVHTSTTPTVVNHTRFDNIHLDGGTQDRIYSIHNVGTKPLTVGAVTISGAHASDFTVVANPIPSVPAGGFTTFTVRFNPSVVGPRTATVAIANNDLDENPYVFDIEGNGVDFVTCAFGPVEIIAQQNFELTAPPTPWNYTGSGYVLGSVNGHGAAGDAGGSTAYLGSRGLYATNVPAANVTFAPVNTQAYGEVELVLRLAALGSTAAQGLDAGDSVTIAVSTNNGATWSNELQVVGSTDAKWSFVSGTGTFVAAYDGDNIVTSTPLAATGYVTAQGKSTVRLTGLPSTNQLSVRIVMRNDVGEIWAVDDVMLFGRKPLVTTWSGGVWSHGTPAANVRAVINANYSTTAAGITACACDIKPGRTVTINSGHFFNIQGEVNNQGTFVIENGGSLVQVNDYASNLGNVTVRRNTTPVRKFDYTYWSSPVAPQTLYNLSPLTLSDKYYEFNPATGAWQIVPSSTLMAAGKGYIVRAPQTFSQVTPAVFNGSFSGVANNGVISTPVSVGLSDWNLIGNPYPSAINADLFLQHPANASLLSGTLYFWTHNTILTANAYAANDYAVYNLLGGVGTSPASSVGVNATIPNGKIASGQGFFALALADGNVEFNNSMRMTGNNLAFYRQSSEAFSLNEATTSERSRIWLDLEGPGGAFKQTLIGYAPGATHDWDRDFDGLLLEGGNGVALYSLLNDAPLSIQGFGLPFNPEHQVPLGFRAETAGFHDISLEGFDGLFDAQSIYLEDLQLSLIHDLKAGPYTFESAPGTFDSRFVLRYTTSQLSVPEMALDNRVLVAVQNGTIAVKSMSEPLARVTISDLLGRELYRSGVLDAQQFEVGDLTGAKQALLVRVELSSGAVTTKKVLY